MKLLKLTLETPAANLALDEALLEVAEGSEGNAEVLRLWESPQDFVVLGRSSDLEQEVRLETCRQENVPVYRRNSGGGVVTVGPGSLMYAVVLEADRLPAGTAESLVNIDLAHEYVLARTAAAIGGVLPDEHLARAGTSDLVLELPTGEQKKFSGNSLRIRRHHFLYHGTLLYNYDLTKLTRWLGKPKRVPAYREERAHEEFVINLSATRIALEAALTTAWNAEMTPAQWPRERTHQLASSYQAL